MKKTWCTPVCNTMTNVALAAHIKAAARSGELGCKNGVFR